VRRKACSTQGVGSPTWDSKLQAMGVSLKGVAGGFAAAGAAAAAFVAIGATAIVLKGSSMVVDAVAFKENSLSAFKLITKTDAAAQEAYSTALATADLLGINRRDTLTSFQQLLTKGFDLSTVTDITKAMADLQAINPSANIKSLSLAIGQIQDKKKLQGEELMQLAEAGLSRGGVMEALAKATGKSLDDVDKMLKAGKVDAKMGVDAILASIKTLTGGELGDAAIQKASSIGGLLKQLSWENLQDRLFLDVDIGPGFDAFKGFLTNLNNLLNANSEAGKRLRSVIGSSFGGLFATVFGDLSGAEGAKTLEATILKIVGMVESVLAGVTGFFSGFGGALADGLGLGAKAFSEMSAPGAPGGAR
jgi:tape measure domain-containing protein